MKKFDLGFGNSVCVREAFLQKSQQSIKRFDDDFSLSRYDYPIHEGDPELVNMTREVIFRQTGIKYKHIFLTNGATGGVAISLRLFKEDRDYTLTRSPFYGRYPGIISTTGMLHITPENNIKDPKVVIMDYPSNPEGLMTEMKVNPLHDKVILDAVYLNRIYTPAIYHANMPVPKHDVMVGSYSKLTGINALRIGWIATNEDGYVDRLSELVTAEYCGLDTATTEILKSRLKTLNWNAFEVSARVKLDYNREEWSRLEKYFGYELVKGVGMFYYAPTDKACKRLLEKANIHYTLGSTMGTTDEYGRFNLGQKNSIVQDAVNSILKADKI